MKKVLLTFILSAFIITSASFAQQVDRNYVVVEIGTGTWCGYCPGAAMGADDLYENGHQVAIIENHNGDSYANTASNARNSYYGITGYPTAFFDGGNEVVGGSGTSSMYTTYLPKYNNAIAVQSDFTMALSFVQNGNDLDVTVDMEMVNTYSGANTVLQLSLTESHIPENWGGLSEVNFVNRGMYPDHSGTTLDFASSSVITENFTITPDASWDLENCELVAFIQDNDTKEILQADKVTLATAVGTNNAHFSEIISPEGEYCENVVSPVIKIKNKGSANLTSLSVDYDINGEVTGTYDWTGDVPFNQYATIELDEITYTQQETNNIDITLTSPNGATDDDPSDNDMSQEFYAATYGVGPLYLELNTDNWGSECSWEVMNTNGDVVASGSGYGNNQTYNETFEFDDGCYTFYVYDSYGDGGGEITIEDSEGTVLFYTDGSYGSGTSGDFGYSSGSLPPAATFNPTDGATDVALDANITISFNQAVRMIDDSEITDSDIPSFVLLQDAGTDIPYTGTINTDKTEITITPDENLPPLTEITLTVEAEIENTEDVPFEETSISFTTTDDDGVAENQMMDIQCFPNPAKNVLQLNGAKNTEVSLYNIMGEELKTFHCQSDTYIINTSDISAGAYLLRIVSDESTLTKRITISK